MSAFKMLDVVALLIDLPKEKLVKGQVGTIVDLLDDNLFEVEFSDKNGETIATLPINGSDLFLLRFELEKA